MKIVFLTTAHNSLSQRAYVELVDHEHTVIVVIASSGTVMIEAVEREQPDLIVAPMLKAVIPASIWQTHPCIIIHPGIKGDRGPSSLDWTILHAYPFIESGRWQKSLPAVLATRTSWRKSVKPGKPMKQESLGRRIGRKNCSRCG